MLLHVILHQNCGRAPLALLQAGCRSLLQSQHAYASSSSASQAAPQAAENLSNNSSAASSIEVTMHGATAVLELNRPKQMNALSTQVKCLSSHPCSDSSFPCSAPCCGSAVRNCYMAVVLVVALAGHQPALVKPVMPATTAYFPCSLGSEQVIMLQRVALLQAELVQSCWRHNSIAPLQEGAALLSAWPALLSPINHS